MSVVSPASPISPATTWARYGLVAVAWLFALGGVIQVFLIGLLLFDAEASALDDHVDFGRMLGLLAVLMPVLALVGRVGPRLIGQAFVVLILYIAQMVLANLDEGTIAALHAINAFLVIGAAGSLGGATLEFIRSRGRPIAESATQL